MPIHPWLLCVALNAAFIPAGPHSPTCWLEPSEARCEAALAEWVRNAADYNARTGSAFQFLGVCRRQ